MGMMNAKFPGSCRECGNRFAKGERIHWAGKGKGARHAGCAERAGLVAPRRTVQKRPTAPQGTVCAECGANLGRVASVDYGDGYVVCRNCDRYGRHD